MTQTPQDNLVGRIFSDRYRLTRKVGEGAMGQVYLARHTFMDKNVAVKVLHPQMLAHDEVVERFQREAKAAAHIEHPNVCAATDFGRYGEGGLFLVMEWLDGRSLEAVIIEDGPLPAQRAIHIAIQAAEGVQRAHELQIVHRDLKPANIMLVTRDGDPDFVKVTDFGVARVPIGNTSKLTQAGTTYGTPSYMSPEQAMGDEIDARADIYALGVMLFEMLSGRLPFEGSSIAHILSMHVTEPAPHVIEFAPDVPRALDELVFRCMAKSPDDRFRSADSLSDALRAIRDGVSDTGFMASVPGPAAQTAAVGGPKVVLPTMAPAPDSLAANSAEWAIEAANDLVREARKRPPRLLILVGIVALVAVGFAVSLGLKAGQAVGDKVDAVKLQSLADERSEFAMQPEIAKALELQAQGKTDAAIVALKSAELNYQSNPHFHFLLGSVLQSQDDSVGAFAAFARAAELRPEYQNDEGLRKAVLDAATDESTAPQVTTFLTSHNDSEIRDALFNKALVEKDRKRRERLVAVIRDAGLFAQLPRDQQLNLEIRDTRGCKELKPLADEIIARDDTLTALRYLDELPKRGCGFLNRSDCYSCLRKDVQAELKERDSTGGK
jgi:tRNA A-37 threonylcarbamoyl transferase component Bud32